MKLRIMVEQISELFEDKNTVQRIKKKLPQLFWLAELESKRAGRTGMEVGSIRERIIVSLLIYKFGEKNVETEIAISQPGWIHFYLANKYQLKQGKSDRIHDYNFCGLT